MVYIAVTLNIQIMIGLVSFITVIVNITGFFVIFVLILDLKLIEQGQIIQLSKIKSTVENKHSILGFFIILCGLMIYFLTIPFNEVPFILGVIAHVVIIISVLLNSRKFLKGNPEEVGKLVGDIV
jgi:hypothetical protein